MDDPVKIIAEAIWIPEDFGPEDRLKPARAVLAALEAADYEIRKPDKIEMEVKLRQLAADSMVGPEPMRPYSEQQELHWDDVSRRAQAALQVYIKHGYTIPTPYRIGCAIYGGGFDAAPTLRRGMMIRPNIDAWKELVVRYADGQRLCNCREAYYYEDEHGHWRCKYGCQSNRLDARDYVAARVLEELSTSPSSPPTGF